MFARFFSSIPIPLSLTSMIQPSKEISIIHFSLEYLIAFLRILPTQILKCSLLIFRVKLFFQ